MTVHMNERKENAKAMASQTCEQYVLHKLDEAYDRIIQLEVENATLEAEKNAYAALLESERIRNKRETEKRMTDEDWEDRRWQDADWE